MCVNPVWGPILYGLRMWFADLTLPTYWYSQGKIKIWIHSGSLWLGNFESQENLIITEDFDFLIFRWVFFFCSHWPRYDMVYPLHHIFHMWLWHKWVFYSQIFVNPSGYFPKVLISCNVAFINHMRMFWNSIAQRHGAFVVSNKIYHKFGC